MIKSCFTFGGRERGMHIRNHTEQRDYISPSRLDLGARCISKVSQLMVLTRGIAQKMRWGRCILDHMMVYRSDDGAAPARA